MLPLLLLGACGQPTPTPPPPTPTAPPTPVDPFACGPEAPIVGPAQGTGAVRSDFQWAADFGYSTGPVLEFQLREEVRAVTVTVDTPGLETLYALVQYGEEVLVDGTLDPGSPGGWVSPPFQHLQALGNTLKLPMDRATDPVGGGCLRIQPAAFEQLAEPGALWVVVHNGPAEASTTVDVNVGVVGATTIDDAVIAAALARVDAIWTAGGAPGIGDVGIHRIPGPAFPTDADLGAIRRTPLDPAGPEAVNVFLVQDFVDAIDRLGIAGGIPGVVGLQGVDAAGVVVALDGHDTIQGVVSPELLGSTLAHEIGHQSGLFHTTEASGERLESLSDTPDCPPTADTNGDGFLDLDECRSFDSSNFMFWTVDFPPQTSMSADQAFVLDRSPIAVTVP